MSGETSRDLRERRRRAEMRRMRPELSIRPVIVTNARNRIAYNIIRSLGQKGIPVFSADSIPRAMSFSSRYSMGRFIYPSPFLDSKGFIDCPIENVIKLKAEVLIPVFEESFLIAKYRDRLAEHVRLVLPTYDRILSAHNKDRWEPVARALDIAVPRTMAIDDLRSENPDVSSLSYPVLIKPKQGGGGWAIRQVDSPEGLRKFLEPSSYLGRPWHRFFIQEKIIGETLCVAMLFCNGKYRAKTTYRQIRDYPVNGGQATLRISIRDEVAESGFKRLLEKFNWHGVCQADFVVDKNTRVPYLIDINPRFWGSLVQGIASGVDFPYLVYRIAMEGDIEQTNSFESGVMTRWLGGVLMTFFPLLKKSRNKLRFVKEFFLPGPKQVMYDDFSIKDPGPFFSWFLDGVMRTIHDRSFKPLPHDSLEGIWE